MATVEQQKAFLDEVVPSCTKYAKENNVPMVSFLIAQCCFESGYGTSGPAKNLKNILGIGPGKRFDSWDSCIKAYFTSTVLGQMPELRQATTFEQYFDLFVESGYCPENQDLYRSSLKSIISAHNLTQYDNGQVVQSGVVSGTGQVSGNNNGSTSNYITGDAQSGLIANKTFDTVIRERETARVEEGSNSELKTFYRINMTGAQFIRQVLAPYCKSKKSGQGGYRLWFSDETSPNGAPGVKLNFKPDQYNDIENKMSENLLPNIDKTYQFTFGSGPDSSVISFNPNYAGMVTSVTGGYEVEGTTTEAITNDMISMKYNRFSDPNRPSTGDTMFDDLQGTFRMGGSSYSFEDMATRAANLWYNMAPYGYTADITVLGDPTIEVQKLCSVAAYTPQGLPHYSSGVYLIYHVTDSISGGSFTSSMNLVRNAITIGTNDSGGIDITLGMADTVYIGEAANLIGGVNSAPISSGGGTTAASGNSSTNPQAANAVIQSAVDWAIEIANDDSHGYNLGARGPTDYDCSGLVTSAFVHAGVMSSTPATGGMKKAMLACGFVEHPELTNDCSNAQVGDVYLLENGHTALYIGNGQIVHAANAEGGALYGSPGDQTHKEILIANWYYHPWNTVLRYIG